ncbi:BnaCnng47970D [Brassica napus]|uniref:BnaCnng47970D protein n=1 Tax=Brassica napus TaxID=3708 RepID=A0A078JDB3_BRANA|nr:BnaCnng47970D [Brassica napus]
MLGSGNNLSRGTVGLSSDTPNLSQVLTLEPIRLGNQSYTRSGELRRVLSVPSREASSEDTSFGMSHPKPSPPVATEELKQFKESVLDTSREAGDLAKKLSESIFKLDKYAETLSSKKRRRSDISPGERMDAANLDKMRNQVPRAQDSMAQRSEERKKMLGLNKRARTPLGDVQGDGRVSTLARQQVIERGSDSPPSVPGETVRIEEKIRRLPVGGEGWETRMKRKRSVATLGNRVMNPDQRVMQQPKPTVDSKLRSCDTQNFRLKSSTGVSGINRLESSFEPDSPGMGGLPRNELETVSLARDRSVLAEQRLMAKGNNKRNLQEDGPTNSSTAILKGNVSRAPRTATVMCVDSSIKVEPSSGVLQAGSSAHAMAQWVGQRPKNSRTRRTNVVPPVIKHAESKFSAQGFATSDFSPRGSPGTTGSLSVVDSSPLKMKRKPKNASSPYGFSESEDSGAGDNKTRERALASGDLFTTPKTGSPLRKNKMQTSYKGGGAWKQGKCESVSSLTTPGFHPMIVKSENLTLEKPLHNVKIASDKNRSKYGRPPAKKVKDRKPSTRRASNSISTPDITGESDDDREDIFAAANSARKAANLACSGKFWKKMDHIFAAINADDMQNIKDQLNFAEELDESLSEAILDGYNVMGIKLPKAPHRPGEGIVDYSGPALSCISDLSFERLDMRKLNEITPLYKRVLSALIEEDDGEEVVQFNGGKNLSLHYASDDSHSERETEWNLKNGSMSTSVHSNEQWIGDDNLSHSDAALGGEAYSNSLGQLQARDVNIPNFPVSDTQYQLMSLDERLLLELQSIGVFPEAMPDLAEETMSTDVMELKEGIYQQIRNKKQKLEKLNITIQKGKDDEKRKIEQLGMDQLVETAHKKRMASRGNKAFKSHKVTRQAASAFIRRTLARCRKFEETGLSCFADPALQDILFSSPSNDAKSSENGGSGTASNTLNEPSNHQAEAKGSGAVSSTKRREALVDDVIGCASSKVTTSIDSAVLSGGGKREDGFVNKNKPKPKEKNENQSRSTHPTGPASRGRGGNAGDGGAAGVDEEAPIDFSKLAFHDLEEIDEQADIGNWFEGLQDIDTAGLDEVPMDDLSFMFG